MANIGSRTINLIEDKYLTLANEEYLRPLSLGNNWTKVRLGLMVALTPNSTNNLIGCSLVLGLCAAATPFANTTGYAAASTGNFVGLDFITHSSGTSAAGDLVYAAGSGNPYFSGTFTGVRRRVDTTNSFQVTSSLNQCIAANTGSLQRRSLLYLDITKGSPNYTFKPFVHQSAQAVLDFDPAGFLDGLEQPGTPIVNGSTLATCTAVTIACDEVAGAFNTANLFWNRAAYALEVYALAVYRAA
jgi:hypothetical protein